MANPVVHWEITGTDAKKIQDFYGKLFDWSIDTNNPMGYGMVQRDGDVGIPGGIGPSQGPARVTVYVQVNDLDAYLKKAESLGGKTVMPPMTIPDMVTLAMFSDPEGNVVGLVKG